MVVVVDVVHDVVIAAVVAQLIIADPIIFSCGK